MIPNLIEWAGKPVGKFVLVALIFVGWTMFNRIDAAGSATAKCELAHAGAQREIEERWAEKAERIAAETRARAEKTQAELAKLEKVKDEILSEIDGQDSACAVPPDLLERLRQIK